MQAIVLNAFGSVDNFAMAELPMPDLREGDVRIKVKAISFNPIDYQIRKGNAGSLLLQPVVLGRDLSGCIDAIHESVTDLAVGDDVFSYVCKLASSGTYAEYVCVPAELVAKMPKSLTYEQAAAIPVIGITASMAWDKVMSDKTTSVFIAGGAGGVGSIAIQLARLRGVKNLTTTAGSPKSRAFLIEQCGLRDEQIIDYKADDFVAQALERNGRAFDIALDLVGGSMLSACCALLAVDGNIASVTEAPSVDDFDVLFEKNASFHSVGANAYSLATDRAVWLRYRHMLDRLSGYFEDGSIALPTINNLGNFSVAVVKQAHILLESSAVQGKLVMTC
jgi:NADPH:quinone reductase